MMRLWGSGFSYLTWFRGSSHCSVSARHSFSWLSNTLLCGQTIVCGSFSPSVHALVIANSTAVVIGVQVSVRERFHPVGCTPESGRAGLGGNSVFNPLRNCQTVFMFLT